MSSSASACNGGARLTGDDQHVEKCGSRNRVEVGEDVVGQRLEQRDGDGGVVAGHQQRVAVGRGGGAGQRGDDAGGTGAVFDDELLFQAIAQLLAENAHADVGDAAGGVGHDQGHRTVGIIGLSSRGRGRRNNGRAQRCGNDFRACAHALSSPQSLPTRVSSHERPPRYRGGRIAQSGEPTRSATTARSPGGSMSAVTATGRSPRRTPSDSWESRCLPRASER